MTGLNEFDRRSWRMRATGRKTLPWPRRKSGLAHNLLYLQANSAGVSRAPESLPGVKVHQREE